MAFTVMAECGATRRRERRRTRRNPHGRPHPRCRRRSDPAPPAGGDDAAIRLRRRDRRIRARRRWRASRPPTARRSISSFSTSSCPISTAWACSTRMRQRDIAVPAIVQTAHGSIEAVISAMRAGAIDFVVKPVGAERLQVSIKNALQGRRARGRTAPRHPPQRRRAQLPRHRQPRARSMARTVRLAERAAKSNIPVLIEGESGVGKELMARAIQGGSERRGKPFVTVNCGALPENAGRIDPVRPREGLLHRRDREARRQVRRGERRHAVPRRDRRIVARRPGQAPARAAGGRDRSGRRAPPGQGRLPPHLGDQPEPDRAGQGRPVPRGPVLPAQRLSRSPSRPCAPAPATFPTSRGASSPASAPRRASASAASPPRRWRCSSAYDWPGNVRQLENAVFRAVVLADGDELTIAEFPQIAAQVEGFDVRIPPAPAAGRGRPRRAAVRAADDRRAPTRTRCGSSTTAATSARSRRSRPRSIRFALAHYRGQMSQMARKLGIGRSTLYRKMKDFGLGRRSDRRRGVSRSLGSRRRADAVSSRAAVAGARPSGPEGRT